VSIAANPEKRAFTIDELKHAGLGSRTFLYQQINSGRLRARKLGRRTVVLAEDRAAFEASLPEIPPKEAA
jgi:hypothetical protein